MIVVAGDARRRARTLSRPAASKRRVIAVILTRWRHSLCEASKRSARAIILASRSLHAHNERAPTAAAATVVAVAVEAPQIAVFVRARARFR